jgi:hypothetical protein
MRTLSAPTGAYIKSAIKFLKLSFRPRTKSGINCGRARSAGFQAVRRNL